MRKKIVAGNWKMNKDIKEAIELYIWSLKDDKLPMPDSDIEVELRDIEVLCMNQLTQNIIIQ